MFQWLCHCKLSCFSRVRLFATLWTVARQAPLSMGFSRQECWSGLPCPPRGDLPNWGIQLASACVSCIAGVFFATSTTWEAHYTWFVKFSSVTQSFPTLFDPMDCSMPGFPVHHQLLDLTQTYVHWVGDAIQPSHPLLSLSPLTFNLSQHQGLF